jgi:8-oxo-dGTP pyrophosphatase MutT (NUDIX family)
MTHTHTHYGIYALIIDTPENKILLIKKTRGPYTGMLDLPGGSPEKNEAKEETLTREIREEVGANVTAVREEEEFSLEYKYHDGNQQCVLTHNGHIFVTEIDKNITETIQSSDTAGCIWVPIETIETVQITPPVQRAIDMHKKKHTQKI